ncbi:IS3 family transposase [Francisellaceae bacterium CB300]
MKENKDVFSVANLCEVMNLSTSSYYRWLHEPISKRQQNDANLDQAIIQIFNEHKSRYGSVRIHDTLKDNGWKVTQPRVSKRMKILDLQAKGSKRFKVTTDSNHNKEVADNLLDQNFNALGVNYK